VKLYLIGSLRNPQVPIVAQQLRHAGHTVFDDWFAAGPEADDRWRDYERGRGRTFIQALDGFACRNVYAFDRKHLDEAEAAVLLLPAGKSGHLELGYAIGQGKLSFIVLDDDPDRYDTMYRYATKVVANVDDLVEELWHENHPRL
jgi:hypothetical protein